MALKASLLAALLLSLSEYSSATEIITDYVIDDCSLVYNRNDPDDHSQRYHSDSSTTEEDACSSYVDGVCDCDNFFFLYTFKDLHVSNNSFRLTENSSLDYTISFDDDVYFIESFQQKWWDYGDRPLESHTYVEFLGYNGDAWNVTWSVIKGVTDTFLSVTALANETLLKPMGGVHVHLVFDASSMETALTGGADGVVFVDSLQITGEETSKFPTESPTYLPTNNPSAIPTHNPTDVPSEVPTQSPSTDPTSAPTQSPTWKSVTAATARTTGSGGDSYQLWSDNVYPLWMRVEGGGNMTNENYILPNKTLNSGVVKYGGDRAFCVFCILAWADIDATIELEGCDDYNKNSLDPEDPDSIYWCNDGTWYVGMWLCGI